MESMHSEGKGSDSLIGDSAGQDDIAKGLDNSEEQVSLISDFVHVLMHTSDYSFVLQDQDVEPHQLGDPSGLLGVILWHAEKRVRLAYTGDESVAQDGATLNVQFVEDNNSVLGVRPIIGNLNHKAPLPCFVVDIIDEAFKNNLVYKNTASLDSLVDSFRQDYESGMIPRVKTEVPRFPEPGISG